jgi:hypothetical protein
MRVTTSSVTDDTVGFDGLRAVVGAGDGVVGRFPGIVCVARSSDPEPLREFLAMCAAVAGPEPGRTLARRLATWMSGPDAPGPELRFGTVAAAGDKLAVYLVGDVDARVDAVGGLTLSGAHAAIGTDRLLPRPTSPVVLSLDGGEVRADPADVHDLRAGVVPGAGVVLRPTGFDLDDLRHVEGSAAGGHEWFDTGEDASDPFADPPRAPGVPAQRAVGVQVGGRNGVAREAAPEATAEVDEPEPAGGPGRHALEAPLPPPQGQKPRADPPIDGPPPDLSLNTPTPRVDQSSDAQTPGVDPPTDKGARGGDLGGDARTPGAGLPTDTGARGGGPPSGAPVDPLTDPLAPEFDAADPFARHPLGPDSREGGARRRDGTDNPTGHPTSRAVPHPADPPADPAAEGPTAPPLEQRRPRPFAGRSDPAFVDPAAPPGDPRPAPPARHGLAGSAEPFDSPSRPAPARDTDPPDTPPDALPVRARSASRTQPGEPAPGGSLFAPAREPAHDPANEARGSAVGSLVDFAPVRTPPHGFAPAPERDPETRPPPPQAAADLLFVPHEAPLSTDTTPNQRRGPRIRGYRCANGHLNDPRSPSCRECAAPIDERVGGLVAGPRPALGRLVFDDGAAHVVDGGYLVGRMPDSDERVRAGELRPIVVDDEAGSVAHAHAEIRVSGWDVMVVDAGSRTGTYVSSPDEGQWTPLPPRRSRRLLPGTRVRLGGRTFVFESSSTVR